MQRFLPALALTLAVAAAAPALANGWPRVEGDADNQHTVYGNGTLGGLEGGLRGVLNSTGDTVVGGSDSRVLGESDGRLILQARGPVRTRPAAPERFPGKAGESSNG